MLSARYAELVFAVERELALARSGRWDELGPAIERRGRLAAELPARPPADARQALARAAAAQVELMEEIAAARAEVAGALARLRDGRGAVRGYARSAGDEPGPGGRLA